MARRRRPDEREDEQGEKEGDDRGEERKADEAPPIDVETMVALREADPHTRKLSLLRIQKLHGNATVQRLMRELESTDATREARMQQIGDRAEEPAPSGRLEKAILYRSMMEAEVDYAPMSQKSEREVVQDDINTIGQIFANYQAAIHMFESVIGKDPASESVPRENVVEFLNEFTSKFFGDVLGVDLDAIPFLGPAVEKGIGAAEDPAEEVRQEKGEGLPTNSLRNLAVAERRRFAAEHKDMMRAQLLMTRTAAGNLSTLDPNRRQEQREELARVAKEVNAMETTTHSAEWMFRQILDAWKDEIRDTSIVQIDIDEQWNVRRAHIRGRDGKKLARQLLADNSGVLDLNELKLVRRIVLRPAELAEVEILMGPQGDIRMVRGNQKGQQYIEEITRRLRREGLPSTRNVGGD